MEPPSATSIRGKLKLHPPRAEKRQLEMQFVEAAHQNEIVRRRFGFGPVTPTAALQTDLFPAGARTTRDRPTLARRPRCGDGMTSLDFGSSQERDGKRALARSILAHLHKTTSARNCVDMLQRMRQSKVTSVTEPLHIFLGDDAVAEHLFARHVAAGIDEGDPVAR